MTQIKSGCTLKYAAGKMLTDRRTAPYADSGTAF